MIIFKLEHDKIKQAVIKLNNFLLPKRRSVGFTVIELLVVIAVIGLLASIVIVATKGSREKAGVAKVQEFNASISNVQGSEAWGIWTFDEGGSPVKDSSGNGNDSASIVGTVSWIADTPDNRGKSLKFDANGQYVDFRPAASNCATSGRPSHTYNDFTVAVWFKSQDLTTTNDQYFFEHWVGISNDTIIFSATDDAGYVNKVRFHMRKSGGTTCLTYGTTNVVDQKWHHLVGTRKGSQVKIYVDSVLEPSTPCATPFSDPISITSCSGNGGMFIGNEVGASNQVYGELAEVRVYDTAFGLAQIKKLYAEGLKDHQIVEK